MRIGRLWATVITIVALTLIGGSSAYGAGTVNIAVNGPGAVNWTVNENSLDPTSGTCPGNCSVSVPNVRECEERICITYPGRIDLYAESANKAYGFTRWDGACQGTNPACSVLTPRTGTATYAATANFGDNAPPSVALTAPGRWLRARRGDRVAADAADNFGVAKVDLALGGATVAATSAPFAAAFDSAQLPDGPTSATARATDVNGLASAVASAPVTIDNTPPTLDVTGPSNRTYAPGSTQVWVLAGADATSGVAALQCSVAQTGEPASFRACSGSPTVEIADNQPPGVYRFTARVVDAAGNVTDVNRDFTIAATLEAALAANGGKLPGSDGTGALAVLPVTLAYDFGAKRNGTRFSALTLKRIPSGASVRVTCAKGCPRKAYKPTKLKSTLSLKPYLQAPAQARSGPHGDHLQAGRDDHGQALHDPPLAASAAGVAVPGAGAKKAQRC